MSKEYTLTQEEREHIEHLSYAMQFIDQTLNIFLKTVVVGRLGITGNVQYKLDDNKKLIIEDVET